MSPYRAQIADLIAAFEIRSERSYAWLGQLFEGPEAGGRGTTPGLSWIERRLHARIYGDWYLTGGPAPASSQASWALDVPAPRVTDRLSAANGGHGAPQPGWTVLGQEDGRIVVSRDGLRVRALPEEIGELGHGTGPGASVTLLLPKERRGASAAFYTLLGDAGAAEVEELDRHYLNVRAAGAVMLVSTVSARLNAARVPFRLKTVDDARSPARADAAVLYTSRQDRAAVRALVEEIRHVLASVLRPSVPALTLRRAAGVGFAEDPGGGESFGSHRCGILVRAAVSSWRTGETSAAARLARIDSAFRERGLDLDRPYLGPAI